jgi:uracil-DNA glycosylase
MSLKNLVPSDWQAVLADEFNKDYFESLESFLEKEWQQEQIFPPREKIFNALSLTPFEDVKVLILGQDPYHDDHQAHGLCFSVPDGIKQPPSLKNIFKELQSDLDVPPPASGCLENWAEQGVLLLNTVLTVRAHQANSHSGQGWENFTDAVISVLNNKKSPVIFVLWGSHAQKKIPLIDTQKHEIICSAHPSPLSAYRGFFGSAPFSKINTMLKEYKLNSINWQVCAKPLQLELF